MELSALLLFAGVLALAAGSPGPSIAALVARVIARGPGAVLPFLAAMWVGEAIWLSAAVFGLAWVAQTFAAAFTVVKWIGVGYLLWLAWQMWHAPAVVADDSLPRTGDGWQLFGAGMAVTLGNPKIAAFYLALLPTLLDVGAVTVSGWAWLVLVMLAVLITVDMIWVAAAGVARRMLRSPRAVRMANRLSATAMGGAALGIAVRT